MPDLLRFLTSFETRDPKGYDIIVNLLLKHYTRFTHYDYKSYNHVFLSAHHVLQREGPHEPFPKQVL